MREHTLDVAKFGEASYIRVRDEHGREVWTSEAIPHPDEGDGWAALDFERKLALSFWIRLGQHGGAVRIPRGAYLQAYLLIE